MHPLDQPPNERTDWERWRGHMDERLDNLDRAIEDMRKSMSSGFEEVKALVVDSRNSGKIDISGVRNDVTTLQKDHERLKGRVNYLLPLATGGGVALGMIVGRIITKWFGE